MNTPPASPPDLEQRVRDLLTRQVRPAIQRDGGDIELLGVEDTRVTVRLTGRCAHCPMSALTLKRFVEATLRSEIDSAIVVEQA